MTLDSLPLPVDVVDPNTIPNNRDQRLNLDSVYGNAKKPNPALFEPDGKHFKVNDHDLPRNPTGSAIIGDPRNDENQVIAQIHVAFLRAHNQLIDQGYKFKDARQLMEWRHQWIVVHEFLPEVLDPGVYADVFRSSDSIKTRYYDPKKAEKADMPVEFSVGAYRFGHSQVRAAYRIVQNGPFIQVFSPTAPDDLRGGRVIGAYSCHLLAQLSGCRRRGSGECQPQDRYVAVEWPFCAADPGGGGEWVGDPCEAQHAAGARVWPPERAGRCEASRRSGSHQHHHRRADPRSGSAP